MSEINVTPLVDVMLVLLVNVDKNNKVLINKEETPAGNLRSKLTNLFATRTKKEVFLKADASVPYGDVVRIMADIKGAGIERLGMVTGPAPK
jgi:biopolymer transport protein TolR